MSQSVNSIIHDSKEMNLVYNPEFYYINNSSDKAKVEKLFENPAIYVYDTIDSQLRELIKSKNPTRKIQAAEYPQLIEKHLDGADIKEYGVWVYYPWSARLVHLLDKEEFIYLRTAANRHKITEAESKILATKKVGIIGLSVGQSVSVTMAMERSFGEIRLADFDTLELNNLNRIRTGVHNLGLPKVISVAREIAEIDPFITTSIYPDGITEENIHDFFTLGGKLDAVIDECDGVHIKILCRIKARELNVPVLMEASDRGTLDVERYDLEPGRPIIHGWLEHLEIDFNILKNLKTSEEKLPYMLPISGLETLSPRMKASMVEIEQTLTTWPQLATAVTLGGALTADTCRRMFLGQFTASGRYFIDLDQLIPDTRTKEGYIPATVAVLSTSEIRAMAADAIARINEVIAFIPEERDINEIVKAATLAPSAGNNQPWQWYYSEGWLFLFHELSRTVSFGDFENIASYAGLGAAIENLALKANEKQLRINTRYFPLEGNKKLIAVISFDKGSDETLYQPDILTSQLEKRETNRKLGIRIPLPAKGIARLQEAVSSLPGAELIVKDSELDLSALADILGAAEKLRILHPAGHYEFYNKEVRWTDEQARETGNGIDIATVDVTPSEVVGLNLVKDPEVGRLLAEWEAGTGLERMARKSVAAASAIGLITMPEFSSLNYILGGRALERMWLAATYEQISIQPMLAATLHFARLNKGNGEGMPEFMKTEFKTLYQRFLQIFPGVDRKGEIFLFRMSIAEQPAVRSYRLPVEKVLSVASSV